MDELPVRDIGEWTGMDKRRRAFNRLHQIRHDGVLHQDRERATAADIVGVDWFARSGYCRSPCGPAGRACLRKIRRQRQNRHNLAGYRDVEAGAAREAFFFRTLATQEIWRSMRVVGVEHPPPRGWCQDRCPIARSGSVLPVSIHWDQFWKCPASANGVASREKTCGCHLCPAGKAARTFGCRPRCARRNRRAPDGGGQKIIRRDDGVNVASEMETNSSIGIIWL